MSKKIIITIIILLIIAFGGSFIGKINQDKKPDITDIPSRNDTTVIPESTSTSSMDTVYSIAEVNLHNKATDCWLVIGDKVIDATAFIASGEHPNDKILNGCGKDATEMFKNVEKHSGPKPQDVMMKSQIGVLE